MCYPHAHEPRLREFKTPMKYNEAQLKRFRKHSGTPPSDVCVKLKELKLFRARGSKGGKKSVKQIQVVVGVGKGRYTLAPLSARSGPEIYDSTLPPTPQENGQIPVLFTSDDVQVNVCPSRPSKPQKETGPARPPPPAPPPPLPQCH